VHQLDTPQTLHRNLDVTPRKKLHRRQDGRHPGHPTNEHVLQDGEAFHQIVVLEDHRYGTTALALSRVEHRAVDHSPAGLRSHEAVDAAKERRLAGTAGAQHDEELAGSDRQVDALKHRLVRV
jgi:hypothetical protein